MIITNNFYRNLFILIILLLNIKVKIILSIREPPSVMIPNQGTISGMYMKMFRTQRIIAYLGIPYAHPPIYEKRFMPPIVDNLPSWDGIRNATEFRQSCWADYRKPTKQHEQIFFKLLGTTRKKNSSSFSEDCLYLNIYIPEDPPPMEGYAVIVWLHSGDFSNGSPYEMNPFQFVFKQKLIVITVSYRLGIFGFFTSIDGEASGNFGLMDQSAALLWINKNIKLFNGNDRSVTLMGHGSGAVSASLHLTSGEWSSQLFDKVIIMSGTALVPPTVRDAKSYTSAVDNIASAFGCYRRPTSDLLGCLRRVDAQILMEGNPVLDWGPIIDDGLSNTTTPFISNDPRILIERREAHKIPVLIGFTNMEDSLDNAMNVIMDDGLTSEMYDALLSNTILEELALIEKNNDTCSMGGDNNEAILDALNFAYKPYPPTKDPVLLRKKFIDFSIERNYASSAILLAIHNSKEADTFVYRFDIKPKTLAASEGIPQWGGVPHGFELIFVWGLPYWVQLENQTYWDTADKRVSDIIMTLWANYAKFTEPTKVGVYINWDKFTPDNQGILIIDRTFNMSDSNTLNYQAIQFWNDYYPKVVDFASQCCNGTDNGGGSLMASIQSRTIIIDVFVVICAMIYMNLLLY